MKKIALLLAGILSFIALPAQEFFPLWEGDMPNSKGIAVTDSVENGRFRRVGTPGMFVFRPSAEENKGAAVLICPPGGYGHHTYDIAGLQLAKWFNVMGVNAFVLISRLPHSPDLLDRTTGPLTDARQAMRIIRQNAGEWGIDTARVGVMGSSAGGHLAATLATFGEELPLPGDTSDIRSFVPDFVILVSPVITMEGPAAHKGSVRNLLGENPADNLTARFSAEKNVTSATAPVFMAHADDDPVVSSANSVLFYQALKTAGVPSALHIFPYGKHSIALRNNPGSTDLWTTLCEEWLKEMKIIN